MSDFIPAYNILMINEGGYQDHPSDPGNYNSLGQLVGTNWGISAPTFEAYYNYIPTKQDMELLTRNESEQIYRSNFWSPYNIGSINAQYLANQIFDIRVNHGNWMWIINRALIAAGANTTETASWSNSSTVNMINSLPDPERFNDLLVEYRIAYYEKLIRDDPQLQAFYNGWVARATRYELGSSSSPNIWLPAALLAGAFFIIPVAVREEDKRKRK